MIPKDPQLKPIDPAYLKGLEKTAQQAVDASRNEIRDGREAIATERVKSFYINYTDPRGGKWCGTFTNHVMTIAERGSIGLQRAHAYKGLVFEQVPPSIWNLIWCLTHLNMTLEKRPDWAKDLWELYDYGLIEAIYAEVTAHEATFCRAQQITKSGEDGAPDEQPVGEPVVREEVQAAGERPPVHQPPGG